MRTHLESHCQYAFILAHARSEHLSLTWHLLEAWRLYTLIPPAPIMVHLFMDLKLYYIAMEEPNRRGWSQ